MKIVYYSKTGNVKRFVNKLEVEALEIHSSLFIDEPYILVTPTTGFGKVPIEVMRFVEDNKNLLKGVASSGNMNWGSNYAKAAEVISSLYNVPIILKFELHGTKQDIEIFQERVRLIELH